MPNRRRRARRGGGPLGALTTLLAAGIAWEMASRWIETLRAERGYEYWRTYADDAANRRADAIRESHALRSTGVTLHVDVYPQPARGAPLVVFNHGAAGYGRMFVGLALALHDRGYTVVLPDQRGQGLSGGVRGDSTITECAQNVVDVTRWASVRYGGPVFIAGGSIGGSLAYYAQAAGAPAQAIACLNLFDFGKLADGLAISRLAPMATLPGVVRLLPALVATAPVIGWLRVPFNWVGKFEDLVDERDVALQAKWSADPIPPRLISVRALASMAVTPPAIPLEQNTIPALVLNQGGDRMVDPAVTRRNYERLGGPKHYVELEGFGHWSQQPAFSEQIVEAMDAWFRAHMPTS